MITAPDNNQLMRVHISYPPPAEQMARLQADLDPVITLTTGEEVQNPADVDVLVDGRPSRDDLIASPILRTLIIPFAGVPPETAELMTEFPQVVVHNLHHNDASTAETAMALLLAAARQIVPIDQAFRRHDWTLRYDPPNLVTLDGKTALILGFGAIGQRVARACLALGMRVLATCATRPADGNPPARRPAPSPSYGRCPDRLPAPDCRDGGFVGCEGTGLAAARRNPGQHRARADHRRSSLIRRLEERPAWRGWHRRLVSLPRKSGRAQPYAAIRIPIP
ncbi:MAG: hypothetical protein J5I90_13100 [Caldilineales bacterium]|nr:hypothetical protein [Caldilineales bacterium]